MIDYEKIAFDMARERNLNRVRNTALLNEACEKFDSVRIERDSYGKACLLAARGGVDQTQAALKRLKSALEKSGYSPSILDEPAFKCDICKDTGRVNGAFCKCVVVRAINENKDNITLPLHDFKSAYSTAHETRRITYKQTYEFLDNDKCICLLIGQAGTGKTYLASTLAHGAIYQGKTVIYITAGNFFERLRIYHTTFDSDKNNSLLPLLDCDLLSIDDLGTEPFYKNITQEYLYLVLNERTLNGKKTVITTNLNSTQISARYGDRILSRLADKATSFSRVLVGKDLRLKQD